MRLRNLLTNAGDVGVDIHLRRSSLLDGSLNRPQQRVGQLEGVSSGNVKAIEQPVADQIEVFGQSLADIVIQ